MKMKVLVLGVAMSIWLMLAPALDGATTTTTSVSGKDNIKPITIVFDVGIATDKTYSAFLNSVRDAVKYKKDQKCHGISMVAGATGYILFELKYEGKQKKKMTIKIATKISDLYVEGYSDTYKGLCRYHLFTDSETDAKSILCDSGSGTIDDKDQTKIYYAKNYAGMESKGGDRVKLPLGRVTLGSLIDKIYDKDATKGSFKSDEAKFLLTAIQMISEAARFSYIEDKVKTEFGPKSVGYKPDPKAISLEEKWKKISMAYAKANPKQGTVKLPEGVKNEKGEEWKQTTMTQLEKDIKLLISSVKDVCNAKLISSIFNPAMLYYKTINYLGEFQGL